MVKTRESAGMIYLYFYGHPKQQGGGNYSRTRRINKVSRSIAQICSMGNFTIAHAPFDFTIKITVRGS